MTFMHRNLFDALWCDIVVDNSLVVFFASILRRCDQRCPIRSPDALPLPWLLRLARSLWCERSVFWWNSTIAVAEYVWHSWCELLEMGERDGERQTVRVHPFVQCQLICQPFHSCRIKFHCGPRVHVSSSEKSALRTSFEWEKFWIR